MPESIVLHVNVAQLLREHTGATRHYNLRDIAGTETSADFAGEVTLTRDSRGLIVTGKVRASARAFCCRCLEPVDLTLTLDIEEEVFPKLDIITGLPLTYCEEDSVLIDEGHILDLGEIVRQSIETGMPMKPLCRPDCAGLCPVCGANLNEGSCGCDVTEVAARWEKLKQIK